MAGPTLILAGDIGGTKTHLALYSVREKKLVAESQATFPSQQHRGLEPLLKEFLAGQKRSISRACFGIAGPVVAGTVKTPNLPWIVEADEIAEPLKLDSISL